MKEEEEQQVRTQQQQRRTQRIKALDTLKESHPAGIKFDFTDKSGHICWGFCWLVFGKTGNRPEVFENKFFRIGCAISPGFEAIVVSIKNYTKGPICIDYNSFRLNTGRIGVDNTNNSLEPQEEATWSLRPFRNGGLPVCLDKKRIVENEVQCNLKFSVMFEDKTTRSFDFNLYTQTVVVQQGIIILASVV